MNMPTTWQALAWLGKANIAPARARPAMRGFFVRALPVRRRGLFNIVYLFLWPGACSVQIEAREVLRDLVIRIFPYSEAWLKLQISSEPIIPCTSNPSVKAPPEKPSCPRLEALVDTCRSFIWLNRLPNDLGKPEFFVTGRLLPR